MKRHTLNRKALAASLTLGENHAGPCRMLIRDVDAARKLILANPRAMPAKGHAVTLRQSVAFYGSEVATLAAYSRQCLRMRLAKGDPAALKAARADARQLLRGHEIHDGVTYGESARILAEALQRPLGYTSRPKLTITPAQIEELQSRGYILRVTVSPPKVKRAKPAAATAKPLKASIYVEVLGQYGGALNTRGDTRDFIGGRRVASKSFPSVAKAIVAAKEFKEASVYLSTPPPEGESTWGRETVWTTPANPA